jgi:hypothetical protein
VQHRRTDGGKTRPAGKVRKQLAKDVGILKVVKALGIGTGIKRITRNLLE